MTRRLLVALLAGAVLVGGCTSPSPSPTPSPPSSTGTDATGDAGTSAPSTPTSPSTPTPTSSPTPRDVVLGTGTVTADGTALAVSGDCDISREFGEQPVTSLDTDDVDVLLAVDNLTGDGGHDGPFALQVRLLGSGALVGRTLTSQGAPGEDGTTLDTTYEGQIEVAELQDRRELEFVDVATLHLEVTQERVEGSEGPARRELVVDVACPISRPA